jgi:hypothetical protein
MEGYGVDRCTHASTALDASASASPNAFAATTRSLHALKFIDFIKTTFGEISKFNM